MSKFLGPIHTRIATAARDHVGPSEHVVTVMDWEVKDLCKEVGYTAASYQQSVFNGTAKIYNSRIRVATIVGD